MNLSLRATKSVSQFTSTITPSLQAKPIANVKTTSQTTGGNTIRDNPYHDILQLIFIHIAGFGATLPRIRLESLLAGLSCI